MTVFARVSQESVQKYHSVVSDILSFDARFNESFNVYDDAIKTLTEHYDTLSETLSKLKAAEEHLLQKQEEYERRVEQLQNEIEQLSQELEQLAAEIEMLGESVLSAAIVMRAAPIKTQLVQKRTEFIKYQQRLFNCRRLRVELTNAICTTQSRMQVLLSQKNRLLYLREELKQTKLRCRVTSENANRALINVEKNIFAYCEIKPKVDLISESTSETIVKIGLSAIHFLSAKFQEYQKSQKQLQLDEQQKEHLINTGVSRGVIESITVGKDGVFNVNTKNYSLEGTRHPKTGILYRRKQIEVNDIKMNVVVPVFSSIFEAKLPSSMRLSSDTVQFKECCKQLKEEIKKNDSLRKRFTERQLMQIENGDLPNKFVWHHNEETGRMQLVCADIHSNTPHTGGRALWGGGKDAR